MGCYRKLTGAFFPITKTLIVQTVIVVFTIYIGIQYITVSVMRSRIKQRWSSRSIDASELSSLYHKYKMSEVDCAGIFNKNQTALELSSEVRRKLGQTGSGLSADFYMRETKDCENFLKLRGYITSPLSEEENNFPIAFSILAYKDIEMFERLLRAIYRPQNFYCVHMDISATHHFFQVMDAILKCFPNVIWAHKLVDVQWGKFTVLEAEIRCMETLSKYIWKYYINLTGQEFPLQTNAHLVKILNIYNGSNDAYGSFRSVFDKRFKGKTPPVDVQLARGPVHVAVSRAYVDFILNDPKAQQFLNWTKKTIVPDETFFATLNNNPSLGVPGAYSGNMEQRNSSYRQVARYKNWRHRYPCAGRLVRKICILSTGDLPLLKDRMELFANKFFLQEDLVAVGCLEELHFNKTLADYSTGRRLNQSFYEQLEFVQHHN